MSKLEKAVCWVAFLFLLFGATLFASGQDTLQVKGEFDGVLIGDLKDTFYDTVQVFETVYDTVAVEDTTFVTVYDTTTVNDTTFVTVYDTANVESLTLRQVNQGYAENYQTGENYLYYNAEAHGDSVRFQYFHNGIVLRDTTHTPFEGFVYDTLRSPPIDTLQVQIHGYWDKWVEPYYTIADIILLDTLGTQTDTTMADYVLDNFNDTDGTQITNHTPDTDVVGGGWSEVPLFGDPETGDTDIQSNEARVNTSNTGAVIDAGQADVSVWADWRPPTGGTGRATIPFRYSDADNHWLVNMREENGDIGLSKIVSGSNNFHVESTSFTWNEGQTYEIEVRLSGNSIRVFVDGTEVTAIARTDNFNNTATSHGIGRATSDLAQPFERFKVDDGGGFTGGGTTIEMGFSLGASSGVSTTGNATAESSFTVSQSSGVSSGGDAAGESLINIAKSLGIQASGDSTIEGAFSMAKALGIATSGDASIEQSISLPVVHGVTITTDTQEITEMSFSAGIRHGISADSDATINVNYSLPASFSQQMQGQATAEGQFTINTIAAIQLLGSALAEAGLSLDAVSSITITSGVITSDVTLADGRTLTITLENRTFTIADENRTFTIDDEDRTYGID